VYAVMLRSAGAAEMANDIQPTASTSPIRRVAEGPTT
jgi:hypothetical protein